MEPCSTMGLTEAIELKGGGDVWTSPPFLNARLITEVESQSTFTGGAGLGA